MATSIRRFAAATATALAACLLTGGVATAEPIWVLPGVDLGAVLGPTVQLPTQLLQPVFDALGG
ncbi:hypothetical protein [Saccharopolyspora shandongensis]|uniref:Uncharacterized protein n=1 Tax=Saccharopolyspora shandongensis TaxID=418495 RepID=A0A1H2U3Y6_9PSEU|nr:hypothetical protein [Saccharopolyspora shandongensis]SDW50648.1 hypothetical protein SAMN05216215_1003315 [Saccharopolyspora shandongensis]